MARGWRVYKYVILLPIYTLLACHTPTTNKLSQDGALLRYYPLYSPISHLTLVPSISLVLLQPRLFNLNLLAGFSPYLYTISRSSFKQGVAWISIALMQELLISIREHPRILFSPLCSVTSPRDLLLFTDLYSTMHGTV